MKKLIALVLVITFIGMHCATYEKGEGINLEPGQKPGAKVFIQKIGGQQVKGELIAVKQNSLLLTERDSGADVTAAVREIKTITIVKKSKALKQGGMGLLIGGAMGVATCTFFLYMVSFMGVGWQDMEGTEIFINYALPYGLLGGGTIGALIGVITGASAAKDKTIQIEGKSDIEIKEILEDLRKKARVPDFQ